MAALDFKFFSPGDYRSEPVSNLQREMREKILKPIETVGRKYQHVHTRVINFLAQLGQPKELNSETSSAPTLKYGG